MCGHSGEGMGSKVPLRQKERIGHWQLVGGQWGCAAPPRASAGRWEPGTPPPDSPLLLQTPGVTLHAECKSDQGFVTRAKVFRLETVIEFSGRTSTMFLYIWIMQKVHVLQCYLSLASSVGVTMIKCTLLILPFQSISVNLWEMESPPEVWEVGRKGIMLMS